MKKVKMISVFLAVLLVFAALPFTSSAAGNYPHIVRQPVTKYYKTGSTAEIETYLEKATQNAYWTVVLSDGTEYPLDSDANRAKFNKIDPLGKMSVSVINSASEKYGVSVLVISDISIKLDLAKAYCTITNDFGTTKSDDAEIYVFDNAPATMKINVPAEINVRVGKVLKIFVEVENEDEFSGVEYYWTEVPEGDLSKETTLDDENERVLIGDTSTVGTKYYRCHMYTLKDMLDYPAATGIITVNVYEPQITVTYSANEVTLGKDQEYEISAYATVEPEFNGELSYQWYKGKNNIPGTYDKIKGATKNKLTVKGTAEKSVDYYFCEVIYEPYYIEKNKDGFSFSSFYDNIDIVKVTNCGPVDAIVLDHPQDAYANDGEEAVFEIKAKGAKSYQWYATAPANSIEDAASSVALENGTDGISGADTAKLTVPASEKFDGYYFCCELKGDDGKPVYTQNAKLTVYFYAERPGIEEEPQDVVAKAGEAVTLSIKGKANKEGDNLKYQWYFCTDGSMESLQAIEGAVDSTYSVNQTEDVMYYCASVTAYKGSYENGPVYSRVVKVEIVQAELAEETSGETLADTSADTSAESVAATEKADTDGNGIQILPVILGVVSGALATALAFCIVYIAKTRKKK